METIKIDGEVIFADEELSIEDFENLEESYVKK